MKKLKQCFLSSILFLIISHVPNVSWAIIRDIQSSQNIYKSDCFLRFYNQNSLAYTGLQLEVINKLSTFSPDHDLSYSSIVHQFSPKNDNFFDELIAPIANHLISSFIADAPNVVLSGGFGYRYLIAPHRLIGFHCFSHLSIDSNCLKTLNLIKINMKREKIQDIFSQWCSEFFLIPDVFSNITLGFEMGHGPLHIDFNFYIPTYTPLLVKKKNNIHYENIKSKKFNLYYPEQGSWGTEIKTTYNINAYTHSFIGPYCFYDPNAHLIPGISLGMHHIKFPWDVEVKYSYDTARGHYFTSTLHYLFNKDWGISLKPIYNPENLALYGRKNYRLYLGIFIPFLKTPPHYKRNLSIHPLWKHPINSNAAPLFIPSRRPRLVENFFKSAYDFLDVPLEATREIIKVAYRKKTNALLAFPLNIPTENGEEFKLGHHYQILKNRCIAREALSG